MAGGEVKRKWLVLEHTPVINDDWFSSFLFQIFTLSFQRAYIKYMFFFCYSFPVVCKDRDFCQYYSTKCQTWPDVMKDYCPKMCGYCGCRYTIIVIHLGSVISYIIYMALRVLYMSSEEMLI